MCEQMLLHCGRGRAWGGGRWGRGAAEPGWGSGQLPAWSSQVPGAGTKAVGMVRGRRSPNLPLAPAAFGIVLRAT